MSLEAVNRVLGTKVGGGNRKVVLLAYANHAHRDGRHAWPSMATVAEYAEVDVRSARRIVAGLVKDGWLRPGDQAIVSHIRADRRQTVYDLAMDEETRTAWASDAASEQPAPTAQRPDKMSPRIQSAPVDNCAQRPDKMSPRVTATTGQSRSPRPDTAASGELTTNSYYPPTPAAAGEPGANANQTPNPAGTCPTHRDAAHPNCRRCGTSRRAIANADAVAARTNAAAARKTAAAEARAARKKLNAHLDNPATQQAIAQHRTATRRAVGERIR